MKTIVHFTPTMDAAAGGPPVVVSRLMERANENGYHAALVTTGLLPRDDAVVLPSQRSAFTRSGRKAITEAIANADILHLHTMWSPLNAVAAKIAGQLGKPYVISPHGMLDPWSLSQRRIKKLLYFKAVERGITRGAARMIYTAQDEQRLAELITGPLEYEIVSLGADQPPASIETLQCEFLENNPEFVAKKCAIFLGRLHKKKRPDVAVRAMIKIRDSHPDANLMIVGSGEAEAELRTLCDSYDLSDHVHFLGFLSGREKWQALCAADVFILPSLQENFGIALAEALHAGLPVLITKNVNIWQEIVKAGAGTVLDEADIEGSLILHLQRLFESPDTQLAESESAIHLAGHVFVWEAAAKGSHAVYDNVLTANQT